MVVIERMVRVGRGWRILVGVGGYVVYFFLVLISEYWDFFLSSIFFGI